MRWSMHRLPKTMRRLTLPWFLRLMAAGKKPAPLVAVAVVRAVAQAAR